MVEIDIQAEYPNSDILKGRTLVDTSYQGDHSRYAADRKERRE